MSMYITKMDDETFVTAVQHYREATKEHAIASARDLDNKGTVHVYKVSFEKVASYKNGKLLFPKEQPK